MAATSAAHPATPCAHPSASVQPKICQDLWQKQARKNSPSLLQMHRKKIPSSLQCKFQHSSHLSYAHLSATTPELSCHQIWLMKGDSSIMLILSRKWKKVLHAFYTKQHVSEFLCMCCGLSGSSSAWNMATEQSVPRTRRCSWQTNGRFSLISILCTHLRLSMLVLCWADPVQLLPATSVLMDSSPVCTARKVFVEDSPQAIVFNTQIHTRNSGLSEK